MAMYRDCVLKCFYKTFFGIFVYIWKSIWKVGFDWASWIRSKNGDSADFGRYRPVSVNFGLNRLESARVGVNLKKKKANQRVRGASLCCHESSVGAAPILQRRCFRDFRMDSEIYIYIYILYSRKWVGWI